MSEKVNESYCNFALCSSDLLRMVTLPTLQLSRLCSVDEISICKVIIYEGNTEVSREIRVPVQVCPPQILMHCLRTSKRFENAIILF